MRTRTVRNASPYQLFHDNGYELNKFLRVCSGCSRLRGCEIRAMLVASILDRELRWAKEWVEIERGYPVCKHVKERKQ